jgi:2-polyprenyl-3-methyl-5-hydroxy-6-metoxy-1,4-benzoquinol methylase
MELADASGRRAVLLRCRNCRLVQVAALPAEADLAAHYSHYSYDQPSAWEVPTATAASLRKLAGRLAPYRASGRLLDVGCGAGAVLRALSASGWHCEGVEVSDLAARRLRQEGFVVHIGTLELLAADLGLHDVVVMSETIEHVRDPRGLMEAAVRVIRPGGALYLTTPHIDSLSRRLLGARWRPIEVPEHLFYFETRSMRSLLRAVGLRPVEIWTDGINPFEILGSRRQGSTSHGPTESLREAAVRSRSLSLAKSAVNAALRVLALGDTLKAVAEAPARPPS